MPLHNTVCTFANAHIVIVSQTDAFVTWLCHKSIPLSSNYENSQYMSVMYVLIANNFFLLFRLILNIPHQKHVMLQTDAFVTWLCHKSILVSSNYENDRNMSI